MCLQIFSTLLYNLFSETNDDAEDTNDDDDVQDDDKTDDNDKDHHEDDDDIVVQNKATFRNESVLDDFFKTSLWKGK